MALRHSIGSEVQCAADIVAALSLAWSPVSCCPYSYRQEIKADWIGLTLMASDAFEPAEAAELWRRMDVAGDSRLLELLATHRAPQGWIEAMLPPELGEPRRQATDLDRR